MKKYFLLLIVIFVSVVHVPRAFAEFGLDDWPAVAIVSPTPPISISVFGV